MESVADFGGLRKGGMNAAILIDFLRRLIKGAKGKVILVLDNLRVQHAKKVKEWLQAKKEQIEI